MEIERHRLARYFPIANVVILLIGILIALIGFLISSDSVDMSSLLINIGSDIIVVALIFFLGKLLYIDPQEELSERLMRIEKSVTTSKPPFLSRAKFDAKEPFTQFLAQGQDVLITGLSLVSTVGPLRTFFKTLVQQGTNLRFLLLTPESPCLELAAQSHGVSPESLRTDIMSSLQHLRQLVDSAGDSELGSVQFRLLKTIPDASIVMRDGNRDTGEIRCELYLYQTDVSERPAFRLIPADGADYYRYRGAVERLWSDSEPPELGQSE
jgi:hypothetical protein